MSRVHYTLECIDEKKHLIVFDGISSSFITEKLQTLLPNNVDILITSKDVKERFGVALDLSYEGFLTREEAIDILKQGNETRYDATAACQIADRFVNMPVALAQAANYLRLTKRFMSEYLERFEKDRKNIFRLGKLQGNIDLFVSIKLVVEQLNEEAKNLLFRLVFLPSSNIPRKLVQDLLPRGSSLDQSIIDLGSLIQVDPKAISLHSLIQEIIRTSIIKESKSQEALSDIGKHCFDYPDFFKQDYHKAIVIYEHGLKDEEQGRSWWRMDGYFGSQSQETFEKQYRLRKFHMVLHDAYSSLGKYPEALYHAESALKIAGQIFEGTSIEMVASLSNVGISLRNLGRHEEALKYQKQALELSKELFEEKDPDFATLLSNVGISLRNQVKHEEALKYRMHALKLSKELCGDKNPDIATSLNNAGLSLGDQGKHEEALKYLKLALELRKELFGEKHPDVAFSLNNVGMSLEDLCKHEEAIIYLQQALDLSKRLLKEKHTDVAPSLNNVGLSLRDLWRYEEALIYLQQALELRKKQLGTKNLDVAYSLNDVGLSLRDLGRHKEALEYLQQALKLSKELLGEMHPFVATSLNNVGLSLRDLGRHKEALEYLQQALEVRKKQLGKKNY